MKNYSFFISLLILLAISIPSAWATNASVNTILWGENFDHFETSTPSTAGIGSGTTVWGGATIAYLQSSTNTKGYNEALAGGTAPELLLSKSNQTWSIAGIPTGGATEMTLTFLSNKTTFAVTTETANLTISGSQKSWTISVDEGKATPETFNLIIKNTGSANARIDEVVLKVKTAGSSDTPQPTIPVEQVQLNKSEITLEVDETETLTPTITPANATNTNVSWETSNSAVATIANGVITAVSAGNATITCKSAENASIYATCEVTVTAAEVPTLTFDFSAQSYTNGVQYSSINADANITITFGDGENDGKYYNTGTAIRVYGGGHMTVTGGEGVTISKILLEFGSGDGTNEISTTAGTYAAGKWTGSAQSVTFNIGGTSGQRRIKVVKVFYEAAAIVVAKPSISGETPFLTSTTVTLIQADADHIYYTTNGDAPTTSSTEYNASFELNATTTVKAIAVKGSDVSDVAEKTFTKVTVMTVPEAKAAIDDAGSTPIENQYVTGIISQIDSYNSTYHSIQYWISADGTTTDQLEVYSGKGLNGADFAGISDLSLGDEVIVKGTLKKYSSTYEFDMNSQIVQLNRTIAAPTFTPNGGGFLTTLNVSLASATEGAEVRYTTDGSDPTSTSTLYENSIELSSTTTIKAAAFKGEFVSVIVTKTFTKGTKIAVAAALDALNSSSPIADQFVYGKISTAPTSNPNSGRLTYKISDDGTTTDELEVYNGFGLNGAEFSDKTDLQVGDEVTVYGTLKIYNEKKEFDAGNYLLEFNRPEVQTYSITYEENGGAEVADVAEATNLPDPLPTTTKDDKAFGGWFTDAEFNTPAVAGAALTSNVTLYAKWNDVSAWAAVYTSNVTLSTEGGTNASAAKVRLTSDGTEYDALKAGTSSKSGAVVVTVPDGATKLHFHAYGWSGESVTLSVTAPDGVTVSPSSVKIAANTGVSSNSPFTLAEGSAPQSEAYFAVTLSGNTDETALTFTATSGKRFVLFGVNHEGGAIPASIAVNPTSLAFGSVEQDAEVEAKTINVTLTEVAAATVALTGDGASAFNIDKSSLTASGVITVTPNTTNVGTYAATITISDNASAVDPVVVNVSMTVTEPIVADDLSGTWALVTDASQLVAGKKVIIAEAVESDGEAKTMGVQNNNNRAAVVSTVASGILTPNVATKTFTLADAGNSKWALQGTDSKYLYAASSNSNYLKSQDEIDDNATWTIGIENSKAAITANGTNTRNIIRFNSTSSLFSCYESGQSDIALYIQQQEDIPVVPEPDYTRSITAGQFGTICLPNSGRIEGATIFEIAHTKDGKIFFDEISEATMVAGRPYIFYPNNGARELKVYYTGSENAAAGSYNGLHGSYVQSQLAQDGMNYILYDNKYYLVDSEAYVGANRAYIKLGEVPTEEQAPAPGRRRVSMDVQGEQVATSNINAHYSDQPMKVMIDNQLYIIRAGQMFDMTGNKIK